MQWWFQFLIDFQALVSSVITLKYHCKAVNACKNCGLQQALKSSSRYFHTWVYSFRYSEDRLDTQDLKSNQKKIKKREKSNE